jgi:hypothetical protein
VAEVEGADDPRTATPAQHDLAGVYALLPGSALTPVLGAVALLSPGAACPGYCTVAGWAAALVCALLDQRAAARSGTHSHSGSPVLLIVGVVDVRESEELHCVSVAMVPAVMPSVA